MPTTSVAWADLAVSARERDEVLAAEHDYLQDGSTFPFGAHVSIVYCYTATGQAHPLRHVAVHYCGRLLNPLIVEGQ